MSEENVKNDAKRQRKRRSGIHSKHAKSLLLYARLAQTLAEVMEDRGLYSDTQLEELGKNRSLVRRIVRLLVRRKIRLSRDVFTMAPEPPAREYECYEMLQMVKRDFPNADHWLKNWLPGITGGYMWNNCLSPPEGTPEHRKFAVFIARGGVHVVEATRMLSKSGWNHAFLYDMFHVRDWNSPHPLFVLGTGVNEHPCLSSGVLRHANREEYLEEGDCLLVWRKMREAVA